MGKTLLGVTDGLELLLLKRLTPGCYLSTQKWSSIHDLWDARQGWSLFHRRNHKDEEIEDWIDLMSSLNGVYLSTKDAWI